MCPDALAQFKKDLFGHLMVRPALRTISPRTIIPIIKSAKV